MDKSEDKNSRLERKSTAGTNSEPEIMVVSRISSIILRPPRKTNERKRSASPISRNACTNCLVF